MIRTGELLTGVGGTSRVTAAVADRYARAWGAADLDAVMAMHAPTTSFVLHVGDERHVGATAVRDAFADLLARWPGFTVEQRHLITGPRHWVLEWALVWSPGASVPQVRIPCLDVVVLDEVGLIATKHTWVDAAGPTSDVADGRRGSAA